MSDENNEGRDPWGTRRRPRPPGVVVPGVGPDAPRAADGRQSESPYRCDLLPAAAVLRVAAVLKRGAAKYGPHAWRELPEGDHLSHALTHLLAYAAGDRSDDHLVNAACRTLFAVETATHPPEGTEQ